MRTVMKAASTGNRIQNSMRTPKIANDNGEIGFRFASADCFASTVVVGGSVSIALKTTKAPLSMLLLIKYKGQLSVGASGQCYARLNQSQGPRTLFLPLLPT